MGIGREGEEGCYYMGAFFLTQHLVSQQRHLEPILIAIWGVAQTIDKVEALQQPCQSLQKASENIGR